MNAVLASSPSVAVTLEPQSMAAKKMAKIIANRREEKEKEFSMANREEITIQVSFRVNANAK